MHGISEEGSLGEKRVRTKTHIYKRGANGEGEVRIRRGNGVF